MVTKRMINTLNNLLDGVFLIILAIFFYLGLPIQSTPIVNVPQGSIASIIAYLSKNGFDINQFDKNILRLLGKPQSGAIDMSQAIQIYTKADSAKGYAIAKGDFLYYLTAAKAAQQSITLIPGETMYFFIQNIASELNLNEAKLWEAYHKYAPYDDGVILPNTYKIPSQIDEDKLISNLIARSMQIHENLATKHLGRYEQNEWFRYVSMASIVQKEAANIQEMPIVAAVIYNRINIGMPLQMDGSLNYGKYSHLKITPERIRNDASPYNTYRNKGVPPAPVGSASIEAIEAVLNPASVDYLYFVRNKNGTHSFSKTFKEHRENFNK
ncbi:aminodeoxychorismate lyase [Helicobacter sp. CLO-3]|uniref:endolytic transglycosylase MltG n=1 Tax=unclassified Helicobacter TaxID=2593540 RepID=UPI0008056BCA|nr:MULTISPECIES: endolytic transglycosylase MltG [unclassified Helicobacter]OBV29705.1 aminodeoxychorismate lyase [Helicobacter sp. CLO-3]OHU82820.1 aminodeoxychorismate lyase [Helicobacter sp. CLO-3]